MYDRLGKYVWDMFKGQIAQEFRHHPDKDEILDRIATSSFVVDEIDKWFEEASFYTDLYWKDRLQKLAAEAREKGIKHVEFRKVNRGKESGSSETSCENCRADGE